EGETEEPTRQPEDYTRVASGTLVCLRLRLLLDHDDSGHRRSVDGAVIGIRSGILERHRIGVVGCVHDHAVPEDVRDLAGRLNAVRARRVPGPRDGAARRDGVHRRVLASVVSAAKENVAHHDLAHWAAPTPPAPPPAPPRGRPAPASRQRRETPAPEHGAASYKNPRS